jgi:hypothetical protein
MIKIESVRSCRGIYRETRVCLEGCLLGARDILGWYGTLVLAGWRSGYVILLRGSLLGSLMPLAHMRGAGLVDGRIVGSSGVFFFVWTLLALGVTALFSVILSARGLWSLRRGQSR